MEAIQKESPDAGDVHQDSAGGGGKKRKKPKDALDMMEKFEITIDFAKINNEQQIVYGWASITDDENGIVTDLQGDQIEIGDLAKAAHDFMLESRAGGDMHDVIGVGDVVESMVFTPDVQKALGVSVGKTGWFIGMKVRDAEVWKRVKSGELQAFSIGGTGRREAA